MRRALALALASASLVAAWTGPARGQTVTAERPDQRVQLDFQHYYTLDELDTSLAALAAAYPEYLRLESMGRSALGNELWVLTVTRLADGDPERKPGLMLVGGLGERDLWGTELSLFTVLELVQNHRRDPRVAETLEHAVLYVVPCAHPDLRAALFGSDGTRSGFEPRVTVDGNFEIGWRPGLAGAGPYPLSQPETFALAQFLLQRDNVAVAQAYGAPAEAGASQARSPGDLIEADALAHRRLGSSSDGAALIGLDALERPGGSLLEFAHGHRGAFCFGTRISGAVTGQSPDVNELFALGQRAFGATLELARALPRLELGPATITRLAPELWQLDLVIENQGSLPTLSALGARRFSAPAPRLELVAADGGVDAGPQLVAAAVRSPANDLEGGDVFDVVDARSGGFSIEELAGGEVRSLRLVVRATQADTVLLRATAPRGGEATLELELR